MRAPMIRMAWECCMRVRFKLLMPPTFLEIVLWHGKSENDNRYMLFRKRKTVCPTTPTTVGRRHILIRRPLIRPNNQNDQNRWEVCVYKNVLYIAPFLSAAKFNDDMVIPTFVGPIASFNTNTMVDTTFFLENTHTENK